MTIEEAIRAIRHDLHWNLLKGYQEDVAKIAISALEKQIPRKVIRSIYNVRFCPICQGSVWQNRDESKYCFRCGQALKWEDKKR